MGNDESHSNVSVGTYGQSHKTVSTNHNRFEEKGEPEAVSNRGPSAYQPNALPLGQTGSRVEDNNKTADYMWYQRKNRTESSSGCALNGVKSCSNI